MKNCSRPCIVLLVGLALMAAPGSISLAEKTESGGDAALDRSRKQVKMLDDLYKTAVVLITTHYVNKETDVSAGTAAAALFGEMKKKGWHEARLVDATGLPYKESNAPSDDFEKKAIAEMKAGKSWYEEVVTQEGKRFLRAATPVPVVMKKCVMCHEHYKEAKEGAAIGAISYKIPVE